MLPILPNQIPVAPISMVMPPVYHSLVVSNCVVLALIAAWAAYDSIKTKSFVPVFIIAGAMLACLTECLWDTLGDVWYAQYGAAPIYRLFNVSVPVWSFLGYGIYLGGLGYTAYKLLNRGMTQRQMWIFYFAGWIANCILEMPVLHLGVYAYYGAQPFRVLNFPLWQAMGNAVMPFTIAGLVYGWREIFTGVRSLLIIPSVPIAAILALAGVGWPTMLAMNSGIGYAATYPAAIVSFGLSLMITYLISVKVCRPAAVSAKAAIGTFKASPAE